MFKVGLSRDSNLDLDLAVKKIKGWFMQGF